MKFLTVRRIVASTGYGTENSKTEHEDREEFTATSIIAAKSKATRLMKADAGMKDLKPPDEEAFHPSPPRWDAWSDEREQDGTKYYVRQSHAEYESRYNEPTITRIAYLFVAILEGGDTE